MKHVEVLFGGSSGWTGGADTEGNISVEGRLDISDSKISEGAGFGIVNYGEIVGCTGVGLSGNTKGKIVSYGGGTSTCP